MNEMIKNAGTSLVDTAMALNVYMRKGEDAPNTRARFRGKCEILKALGFGCEIEWSADCTEIRSIRIAGQHFEIPT